jgi:hypothetical protein
MRGCVFNGIGGNSANFFYEKISILKIVNIKLIKKPTWVNFWSDPKALNYY